MTFLLLGIPGISAFAEDNPPALAPADSQQVDSYQESQRQLMKKFDEDKAMSNYKLSKELAELGDTAEDDQKRRQLIQDNEKQIDALRDKFQQSLRELQREERKVRYGREELERPIFQYDEATLNYYRNQEFRKKSGQNQAPAGKQAAPPPSYLNQPANSYTPQQNFSSQPLPAQQPSAADQWYLDKLSNQAAAEKEQMPPAGALYQPMSQTIKSITQDPHRTTPNSKKYLQNQAR